MFLFVDILSEVERAPETDYSGQSVLVLHLLVSLSIHPLRPFFPTFRTMPSTIGMSNHTYDTIPYTIPYSKCPIPTCRHISSNCSCFAYTTENREPFKPDELDDDNEALALLFASNAKQNAFNTNNMFLYLIFFCIL